MKLTVAVLSLAATAFFFYEYLPPFKWVHFWADFDGFHYPLLNYAHKALQDGRFPEWDHTIYSGHPFAGNPNVGLFYPPNWSLFVLNRAHYGIRVKTLEWLQILHIWLAFYLAWLWLHRHRYSRQDSRQALPAILGAGVFAFAGYPIAELQHYGVICGYAWIPLGLLSLDSYQRTGDWRKLWMLAAASALCLLAGYPAHWFAFCAGAAVYATAILGIRGFTAAFGTIAFSGLLCAIQLGPSLEAIGLKIYDIGYYPVFDDPWFAAQFLLPNFHDNSVTVQSPQAIEQYNYLGSPVFGALVLLAVRRAWRPVVPALIVLAVTMLVMIDPWHKISLIVHPLPVIREICRAWNFLALLCVCAAMFTAAGLSLWPDVKFRRWALWAATLLPLAWATRQFIFRQHNFWLANGWWSAAEVVICLMVFAVGFSAARVSRAAAAATLLAVLVEYHVYGAARRFNAQPGISDSWFHEDARTGGKSMMGVDNAVYNHMLRYPTYRTAIMWGAPHPTDMRHYGLATPQGFDPLLSRQYKEAVEKFTPFESNRIFPAPDDSRFWDRFAVRFLITRNETELQAKYKTDPRLRLLEPARSFYNIFEYRSATPAYAFDAGTAECLQWKPEDREFRVQSATGGSFILKEQFFPGWKAYLDGKAAPVTRALDTFQSIDVPPGEHRVEFRYRSMGLRIGAVISLASLIALVWFARPSRS